jgi:hypothetical protein
VWVRDEFFSSSLDGSFDPIKGVVSGIFSGIDGFLVNFLGYSWFFIFWSSETMWILEGFRAEVWAFANLSMEAVRVDLG